MVHGLFSFFHSFFAFVMILLPLVVIHELGHYFFARIFGVKAEVFSIGFGPRLLGRKWGDTDWRISAIPLGGYVKILGEEVDAKLSEEDWPRSLHAQQSWKRFFIFFGGPLFNFLMAVVIFMVILMLGEPQVSNVIGRVVKKSVAEKAGLQNGDIVLSVGNKKVKKLEDMTDIISKNPDQLLVFEILRPEGKKHCWMPVHIVSQDGYTLYGERQSVGVVKGLLSHPRSTHLGVSNPLSIAGRAGLITGDQIQAVNHSPLSNWEEWEHIYSGFDPETSVVLTILHDGKEREVVLKKPSRSANDMEIDWGLFSSELFVEKVLPHSPAEGAGIQKGDRIVSVSNEMVYSFFELKEKIQDISEMGGKIEIKWERRGQYLDAFIVPTANHGRDLRDLKKRVDYTIGVTPWVTLVPLPTVIERTFNPWTLLVKSSERMAIMTYRNFVSLKKIMMGDVSVNTLGGPIMIGKIAGESLSRGLIIFLTNMALFSIGLGVLNVLPIPVLDGGHLLLLAVEAIRGKPLTLKETEIVQSIGLVLILILMGIAFWNDFARLFHT